MDSTNSVPHRPQLRKVKRPINRVPQSAPLEREKSNISSPTMSNPFVSNQVPTKSDAFDLDSYLDTENLPSVQTGKGYDRQFLQEDNVVSTTAASANFGVSKKSIIFSCLVALIVGFVTGKYLFNDSKVVRNGLQGVVINPEVPRGRVRCGVAEKTQGCVLYIMNPQRQDATARDFYDLATQMTGRQRFVIETGNMRYANTKIKPGEIVQLNIPPL